MSRLDALTRRSAELLRWPGAKAAPAGPAPRAAVKSDPGKEATKPEESAELLAQRDRLLEKFTVMQADLGGAFYEMAIRDHVRLDVLTRKAAELQRVDAELLAVERVLQLERAELPGSAPAAAPPTVTRCASAPSAGTRWCRRRRPNESGLASLQAGRRRGREPQRQAPPW